MQELAERPRADVMLSDLLLVLARLRWPFVSLSIKRRGPETANTGGVRSGTGLHRLRPLVGEGTRPVALVKRQGPPGSALGDWHYAVGSKAGPDGADGRQCEILGGKRQSHGLATEKGNLDATWAPPDG